MPTSQQVFEGLTKSIRNHSKKFRVISKKKSWLHRFIGGLLKGLRINKVYMTRYWTTLGHTVAHPVNDKPGDHYKSWPVLPHEGNHSLQAKRFSSFLFGLLYLMGTPVALVLVLLLLGVFSWTFIWVPWWAIFIWLGAGVLLSFPVPFGMWRGHWEREAYALSVATEYWRRGRVPDSSLERTTKNFTTSAYFWMWPFKKSMMKRLRQARKDAMSGSIFEHKRYGKYYLDIYKYLKDQGLTSVVYANHD